MGVILVSDSSLVLRKVWWLFVACRKIFWEHDKYDYWESQIKHVCSSWGLEFRNRDELEAVPSLHKSEESRLFHQDLPS